MNTYRITIHLELVPCHETPTPHPCIQDDGSVHFTITEQDAVKIDTCEHALLQATYPALRQVLSTHLSTISTQKATEAVSEGQLVANPVPYQVDGEVGRFVFTTHQIHQDDLMVYDTAREVFPPRGSSEWYKTTGFKEVAWIYGATEGSYHTTAAFVNRIRHQPGATPTMTLRTGVEREGAQILACLDRTAAEIFRDEGLTPDGHPVTTTVVQQPFVPVPRETVTQAIESCELEADERNAVAHNPVPYEQASQSVNLFIDEVVVKKQKAVRPPRVQAPDEESGPPDSPQDDEGSDPRVYIHQTVAHIQTQEGAYSIVGANVVTVLRLVLAYLVAHGVLASRLQWFVDGQCSLRDAIEAQFAWVTNRGIILDWYHLRKKCQKQLSLAMTGKDRRHETLKELSRWLWYGMVDQAIAVLQQLDTKHLKQPDAIRVLSGYLERNRPCIPCYAVRKQLGLRNSSQLGEKMNDLLVSDRQKHKGMSWSPRGSLALAAIEAMKRNDEYHLWFEYGTLKLKKAA